MPATLNNSIDIARTPADVYVYVTQPWLWHEWHPNSKSARAGTSTLQVGDHFDETIEIEPLSPLPPRLRRATRYTVQVADPGKRWEVRGETRDGWLEIRYAFSASARGTRFDRTLIFETRGASRLLMPLLRPRMARNSVIALDNLKRRLENKP